MKYVRTITAILGILFVVFQSTNQDPIKKTDQKKRIDLINIDEGSLHAAETKHKKEAKVAIDTDGLSDDDDDEDDAMFGSGSGLEDTSDKKESTLSPTKLPDLTVMDTPTITTERTSKEVKEIIVSGKKPAESEKNNTKVMVLGKHVLTVITEGGKKVQDLSKSERKHNNNTSNHKEAETTPPAKKQRADALCNSLNCHLYGAECVEKEPGSYDCVCPAVTCPEEENEMICGSDGYKYKSLCHMKKEACKNRKILTVSREETCMFSVCPIHSEPKWSNWSMWIKSGGSQFRFRVCLSAGSKDCSGKSVEERKCLLERKGVCMNEDGKQKSNAKYSCTGADVNDYKNLDIIIPSLRNADYECRFSLYDTAESKFVHSNWTLAQVHDKGDRVVWCAHRGMFIPFLSPYKRCDDQLQAFCSKPRMCSKRKRKQLKNRGDAKRKCWKKFLLGEILPTALSTDNKYFICQRFAETTEFSQIFGTKSFFGTVFDTKLKTPLMSFGRFRRLGDESWPAVPFMIERGLKKSESREPGSGKKKESNGMVFFEPSNPTFIQSCEIGENMALESDYTNQPYQILHLLPPELAGSDVGGRVSTFTMTNTVPVHASLLTGWKSAIMGIRTYAFKVCGITDQREYEENHHRRKKNDSPDLHIISGRVPSSNITIGNEVNVPSLIWLAGCCVRGGETKSFSIYVRNEQYGQIAAAPVEQLEVLLSDLYKSEKIVRLFPALNGMCANFDNDVSKYISL